MAGSSQAGSSQVNERANMEIKGLAASTMVVIEKVEKIDAENASKIVGHLLSLEHGEQEMINLAHVTEDMFMTLIEKTREELNLPPIISRKDKQQMSKLSLNFTPFIPSASHLPRVPPVTSVQIESYAPMIQPVINNFEYAPVPYFRPPSNGVGFHHHPQLLPMEAQTESGFPTVPGGAWNAGLIRGPFLPDMRYYQQHNDNNYPRQEEPEEFRKPWIQRLEMELVVILKSKGPVPIPVTSLPSLYSANFGQRALMVMQARVGCSLHDLLAQMPSRIRVIESPNGGQCVILSEDIPAYVKNISGREEREQAADTSCQIYLTFSFLSTFTSQDVYDYFTTFGPVRGVKLPNNQPRRMYGFVTFAYAVSAAIVLSMGNPHFIRGRQVLVKPYRGEQVLDRKSDDSITFSIWSLTADDSNRMTEVRLGIIPRRAVPIEEIGDSIGIKLEDPAPSTHTPGIYIENDASSSHVPYVHADAGPSAPSSHVPYVHADVGSSASSSHVPYVHVDAGPSAPRGVSIGSADRGQCIVTDPEEEERYNHKGKAIFADVTDAIDTVYSEPRLNDIGKITITDADEEEEACVNDIGKITVTDADEEGRYEDLNLPDSPFAFEASAYDFAATMGRPEWDMSDSEL